MAGFNNDRVIGTALLMPTTAVPTLFGSIGSIDINSNRFLHAYGTNNTFLGTLAGNYTLTVIDATSNTGIGSNSLNALTTGANNCALGAGSLLLVTTGDNNIAVGDVSGSVYTTESNNITIGNIGTVADSGVMRFGTAGTHTQAFMAGVIGVSVASPNSVVIDSVTGQLGVAAGGGSPIITITGNDGIPESPSLGNFNIVTDNATVEFLGSAATETLDFGITNLILGSNATAKTTATENVGMGQGVFSFLTSGSSNVAIGFGAGQGLGDGSRNIFIGRSATGGGPGSGQDGVAIGYNAQSGVFSTNTFNIAIGTNAGAVGLAAASNSNILLNALNANSASNQLIIGAGTGTGSQQLSSARICGIDNVNVGSVAKVVTMASDQLGTATITAGTGITVTPGANSITISSSGADLLAYTSVNSSPYVVLAGDEFLGVDCSVIPITVQLPNAPSTGRVYIIKDSTGSANTNNITVTTVGGAVNIDGATTYVMNTQYASIQVLFDGSTYQVF